MGPSGWLMRVAMAVRERVGAYVPKALGPGLYNEAASWILRHWQSAHRTWRETWSGRIFAKKACPCEWVRARAERGGAPLDHATFHLPRRIRYR